MTYLEESGLAVTNDAAVKSRLSSETASLTALCFYIWTSLCWFSRSDQQTTDMDRFFLDPRHERSHVILISDLRGRNKHLAESVDFPELGVLAHTL